VTAPLGLNAERLAALRAMDPELFSGDDGHIDADALLAFFQVARDTRSREAL